MNMRRLAALVAGILAISATCAVLSGCSAGLGLLALDQWKNWFNKDDPASYRVFVDGYDIGATPTPSGLLNIQGVSEGDYLVSVSQPPLLRRGLHAVVHIAPGHRLDLRNTNPFEGGVVTGKVRRDGATGPFAADVRVIAVREGASAIRSRGGAIQLPPVAEGLSYMIGYTDGAGTFRLGPAEYGDWLVVATEAGRVADTEHVRVTSSTNGNANLVLVDDPGQDTGAALGTVTSKAGALLGGSLITATLDAPYVPDIPAASRTQVQSGAGETMPAGPWFEFITLTTVGSGAAAYQMQLPTGIHSVEAYKFPWKAASQDVGITSGGGATQNFALVK